MGTVEITAERRTGCRRGCPAELILSGIQEKGPGMIVESRDSQVKSAGMIVKSAETMVKNAALHLPPAYRRQIVSRLGECHC